MSYELIKFVHKEIYIDISGFKTSLRTQSLRWALGSNPRTKVFLRNEPRSAIFVPPVLGRKGFEIVSIDSINKKYNIIGETNDYSIFRS